jgi:hypothetical protein
MPQAGFDQAMEGTAVPPLKFVRLAVSAAYGAAALGAKQGGQQLQLNYGANVEPLIG